MQLDSYVPTIDDRGGIDIDKTTSQAISKLQDKQNRAAVLVCYFDRQLATVDYLQIGDLKLLHIGKTTLSDEHNKTSRESETRDRVEMSEVEI